MALLEERDGTWEFGGGSKVQGRIARYTMVDGNFRDSSLGVRGLGAGAPHRDRVHRVQPVEVPAADIWSTIARRSVCFRKAAYWPDPAFLLFLMATVEPYRLQWPAGGTGCC
jgi:hypothetical protein